jgi:hypothetical protein
MEHELEMEIIDLRFEIDLVITAIASQQRFTSYIPECKASIRALEAYLVRLQEARDEMLNLWIRIRG